MRRYLVTECRDEACNGKAPEGARIHGPEALNCHRCGGPLEAVSVVREADVTALEHELAQLRITGSQRTLLAQRAGDAVRKALGSSVPRRTALDAAEAAMEVVDPERGWVVLDKPETRSGAGYTGRDR